MSCWNRRSLGPRPNQNSDSLSSSQLRLSMCYWSDYFRWVLFILDASPGLQIFLFVLLCAFVGRVLLYYLDQMLLPKIPFFNQLLFCELVWVFSHRWINVEFEEELANLIERDEKSAENHALVKVPLRKNVPDTVDALFIKENPPIIDYHPDYKRSDARRKNSEDQ